MAGDAQPARTDECEDARLSASSSDPSTSSSIDPPQGADADEVRLTPVTAAAPFNDLESDLAAEIEALSEARQYEDGETIAAAGQFDGSEFLIVRAGGVNAASVDSETGAMILERVLAPGVIGLARALSDEAARPSDGEQTLTAVGTVNVAAIEAADFAALVDERPLLARRLLQHFAKALAERPRAIDPKGADEQRVYALLADAVERVDGIWRIAAMPKHRDLAEGAQVSETAAAGAVARLIRDGVAARDYPALIIHDIQTLKRLAR